MDNTQRDDYATQTFEFPLSAGLDKSVADQGSVRGLRALDNFVYGADEEIVGRGGIQFQSSQVGEASILLHTEQAVTTGVAGKLPMETEVLSRFSSNGRILDVQAVRVEVSSNRYTLVALRVHDDIGLAITVSRYVVLLTYNEEGVVVDAKRVDETWLQSTAVDTHLTNSTTITGGVLLSVGVQLHLVCHNITVSSAGVITVGAQFEIGALALDSVRSSHFVWTSGSDYKVAFWNNSTSALRVFTMAQGATSGSGTDLAVTTSTNMQLVGLYHTDVDSNVYLFGNANGVDDAISVYKLSAAGVLGGTLVIDTTQPARRLALVPGPAGTIYAVWEPYPSDGGTKWKAVAVPALTASGTNYLPGAGIADAGVRINGRGYIGMSAFEGVQTEYRSHVLVELTGTDHSARALLAASDAGIWMPVPAEDISDTGGAGHLASWIYGSDGEVELPVLTILRTTGDQSVPATDEAVDKWVRAGRIVRVTETHRHHGSASLGPNRYYGGSLPLVFDGTNTYPVAFPLPPRALLADDDGAASPGLTGGTYSWVQQQSRIDRAGQIADSPVSPILADSTETITEGHDVELTIPLDTVWVRPLVPEVGSMFRVDIYRNPAPFESGETTQRLASTISIGPSLTGVIQPLDNFPTSHVANGALLADILNGPIRPGTSPSLHYLWVHGSRLFGVDNYDRNMIRFTTEYTSPTVPYWDDILAFRVDQSGGPVYAGASLNDRNYLFHKDKVSVVDGVGPDGTGRGEFAVPRILFTGVGVKPGSEGAVVETPSGIFFVHSTGVHRISTEGQLQHVGAPLQARVGKLRDIHRAIYSATLGQVWFLTDLSTVYVFDVVRGKWSVLSFPTASFLDVAEVDGVVYLLDATSTVFTYSPEAAYDVTDNVDTREVISAQLETPYIRVARGSMLRLRKAHLAGKSATDGELKIIVHTTRNRIERDYEYTYSIPSGLFQLPLRATAQQCDQFYVTVQFTPAEDSSAWQLSLTSLELEVSVIPGTGKSSANQRPTITAV
jgi:hypothetical protein